MRVSNSMIVETVLDLGCRDSDPGAVPRGSFVVRVDLEKQAKLPGTLFVQADAARLPFRSRAFRRVFCSHSLEHFSNLVRSLDEIGRVIEPGGSLVVSVPDCRSFTDRAYRWLSRGGGHVNGFRSAGLLADRIHSSTGLRHSATRTLCTSLAFMNRRNARRKLPGRMAAFLWGAEPFLVLLNALFRLSDRYLGTRASVYGWILHFGEEAGPVTEAPWINVCVRCGRGHPSDQLRAANAVCRRIGLIPAYRCPACGASNVFFHDEHFRRLL